MRLGGRVSESYVYWGRATEKPYDLKYAQLIKARFDAKTYKVICNTFRTLVLNLVIPNLIIWYFKVP